MKSLTCQCNGPPFRDKTPHISSSERSHRQYSPSKCRTSLRFYTHSTQEPICMNRKTGGQWMSNPHRTRWTSARHIWSNTDRSSFYRISWSVWGPQRSYSLKHAPYTRGYIWFHWSTWVSSRWHKDETSYNHTKKLYWNISRDSSSKSSLIQLLSMAFIHWMTSDRSFSQIDERFALKLWDAIRKSISNWVSQILVMDIACWPEWRAIGELVWDFRWRIKWIGIDFEIWKESEYGNLSLLRGDLFELPSELKGISDITYCAHILPKLGYDFDNWPTNLIEAIFAISQTLSPWWSAFIDEWVFSVDYEDSSYNIEELKNRLEKLSPDFNKRFKVWNDPELGPNGNYLLISRK